MYNEAVPVKELEMAIRPKSCSFLLLCIAAMSLTACAAGMEATPPPSSTTTEAAPTLEPPGATISLPTETTLPEPTQTPLPTATASPDLSPRTGIPIGRLAAGTELALESIWMVDVEHGWAIGGSQDERMHVLRTEDGGSTWQDVTPPEPVAGDIRYVQAVADFLNEHVGWVTFQHPPGPQGFATPVVWLTQDGGASWMQSEPLDVDDFLGFYGPSRIGFSDRQSGWLMLDLDAAMMHRYIALYTTADGGMTWSRVVDPQDDAPIQTGDKTGLMMDSAGNGLLTRDLHGLVEGASVEITRDGGAIWVSLPLDVPDDVAATQVCAAHSPDIREGRWAVGVTCLLFNEGQDDEGEIWLPGNAYLFLSDDGGDTWSRRDAPGGRLAYLAGDVILSLGRELHRSQDGGVTWAFIKSVAWDADFSFLSAQRGWAAARAEDERALVSTLDGGLTWQELFPRVP